MLILYGTITNKTPHMTSCINVCSLSQLFAEGCVRAHTHTHARAHKKKNHMRVNNSIYSTLYLKRNRVDGNEFNSGAVMVAKMMVAQSVVT